RSSRCPWKRGAAMEKYQFTTLAWLKFPDRLAQQASQWYQGAGWYFNDFDESGRALAVRLITKSDPATDPPSVSSESVALHQWGAEGWSMAEYVPAAPEASEGGIFRLFGPSIPAPTPYFILQRRKA